MKTLILILTTLLITGCNDISSPEVVTRNQAELDKLGKKVGVLPDGRELRMITIDPGNNTGYHYVYIVDKVVSDNYSSGKSRRVVITIDGNRASIEDLKKLEDEK